MKKRLLSMIALVCCVLSACIAFAACDGTVEGDDGQKYSINKTSVTLEVGEQTTLTVTATPSKELNVQWSVAPAGIATVENGTVTAVSVGTAIVTATVDGKVLACTVNVTEAAIMYTYTLNKSTLSLEVDEEETLTVTCDPATPDVTYAWESSDTTVATVNNGKVTAVGGGTANISLKVGDEEVASCTVTVTAYTYTIPATLSVDYGATNAKITVSVTPQKTTAYTFTVDKTDIITSVDNTGAITLNTNSKLGNVTVTVKDNGKTVGTCTVAVKPVVMVTPKLQLHDGGNATLDVTTNPILDNPVKAFEVTSGGDVVSVTDAGVVSATKNGMATIKATIGGVEKTCEVTVADTFVTDCTIAEINMGTAESNSIDITAGAEYWEQYIAKDEVNHKKYDFADEDIITHTFPIVNSQIHWLQDYQAWLTWNGGATGAPCQCGKCNKDTHYGGDGGWTNAGTKAYFSLENGTENGRRTDLLDVKHTFDIKVFPGASTIKIYTGGFKMTAKVDVKEGTTLLATNNFTHGYLHKSDILTVAVDVVKPTTITLEFVITNFTGNGFISFAGASVSGDVYRLGKTSTQLMGNATEDIVIKKNGQVYTGGTISYVSDTPTIVTVDNTGKLTPVAAGTATVTVTVDSRVRKLNVKVVEGNAAANVSNESFAGKYIDLMRNDVLYWEYYLNDGTLTSPTNKTGEQDLIVADLLGKRGETNGYGAFINFTGGSTKTDSYDNEAYNKYSWGSDYSFTIKLPTAGSFEIRVYTGAWENTVNKTSLFLDQQELSSVVLAKQGGGRSTLVTFDTVTVASDVSLTLKIHAQEGDNCRLMAIAIVDKSVINTAATTTMTLVTKTEMTGTGSNTVNLSDNGNIDWIKYYVEGAPGGSGEGSVAHVRKKVDAHLIGDVDGINGNRGWDYKAAITWSDEDGEVNAGNSRDGDFKTSNYHNNFVIADKKLTLSVNVNANVKTITLYVSAYDAAYGMLVDDSHGNRVLIPTKIADKVGGQSKAYAITLNVNATSNDTLTFRLYKTDGSNVGVAAVAVGGTTTPTTSENT